MARFTPEFLDESKARLRPSDVIGKHVKLQKRGNAWWGLSPFKPEKTPSFSVDDRRGTYHCFSTQNHGDIITFLIETQGLTFPEAVERLSAHIGCGLSGDPERKKNLTLEGALAHRVVAVVGSASPKHVLDDLGAVELAASLSSADVSGVLAAHPDRHKPDTRRGMRRGPKKRKRGRPSLRGGGD